MKSVIPKNLETLEDGDTLLHPVLFISEFRGFKLLADNMRKPICTFTPFSVLHPTFGAISKGHFLCNSKKTFELMVNHPAMDKSYRIVKKLPRETDRRGHVIIRDRGSAGRHLHELTEEERKLYRALVEMEARYFTKGSDYTVFKENIKSEETKTRIANDMNTIRKKLNLAKVEE